MIKWRKFTRYCDDAKQSPPQSHLGRGHRYPSRQRLDSPASCAIPTADESNHSATGTLHIHGNATCNSSASCSFSILSVKKLTVGTWTCPDPVQFRFFSIQLLRSLRCEWGFRLAVVTANGYLTWRRTVCMRVYRCHQLCTFAVLASFRISETHLLHLRSVIN